MAAAPASSTRRARSGALMSRSSQPARIFTVTGIRTALTIARMMLAACTGSRMRLQPALCFAIFGTGQPMLTSTTSAPMPSTICAASAIFTGSPPKIWIETGRSSSVYSAYSSVRSMPRTNPSALTISVTTSPQPPFRFTSRRNAVSVMPAIGASATGWVRAIWPIFMVDSPVHAFTHCPILTWLLKAAGLLHVAQLLVVHLFQRFVLPLDERLGANLVEILLRLAVDALLVDLLRDGLPHVVERLGLLGRSRVQFQNLIAALRADGRRDVTGLEDVDERAEHVAHVVHVHVADEAARRLRGGVGRLVRDRREVLALRQAIVNGVGLGAGRLVQAGIEGRLTAGGLGRHRDEDLAQDDFRGHHELGLMRRVVLARLLVGHLRVAHDLGLLDRLLEIALLEVLSQLLLGHALLGERLVERRVILEMVVRLEVLDELLVLIVAHLVAQLARALHEDHVVDGLDDEARRDLLQRSLDHRVGLGGFDISLLVLRRERFGLLLLQ